MDLRAIVEKYRSLTGGAFGVPVALAAFGLDAAETARLFSQFDEDYHISRYFHFTDQRNTVSGAATPAAFTINAFPQTHVSLDAEIHELL
jgi:hypothetical protein